MQWDSSVEVNKVVLLVCGCRRYHAVTGLQGWDRAEGNRGKLEAIQQRHQVEQRPWAVKCQIVRRITVDTVSGLKMLMLKGSISGICKKVATLLDTHAC